MKIEGTILCLMTFTGKALVTPRRLDEYELKEIRAFGEAHKGEADFHYDEMMLQWLRDDTGALIYEVANILRRDYGLILKVFAMNVERGRLVTVCHVFGPAAWEAFKAENSWMEENE